MRFCFLVLFLCSCSCEAEAPTSDSGTIPDGAVADLTVGDVSPDGLGGSPDADLPDGSRPDSGAPDARVVVNDHALFVSLSGDDGNDGRSRETAFRTLAFAALQAVAGETIYVEAGDYGAEQIAFGHSGEPGLPITLEGYQNEPGDRPFFVDFDHESALDAARMPLLDAGERGTDSLAIDLGNTYIVVRNLQVRNYAAAIYASGAEHVEVHSVYLTSLGVNDESVYSGKGIIFSDAQNCLAHDSVVVNAGAEGIMLIGDNNRIDGCAVYSSYTDGNSNSTDYYMMISGSSNTIENSLAVRVGELEHVGHGIGIKDGGHDNIIRGNEAVGFSGASYYVRHRAVQNNLFQDNLARNGPTGILIRDGASSNVFERQRTEDVLYPIMFLDTGEDEGRQFSGNDNVIRDGTFIRSLAVISLHDYEYDDVYARRNSVENCTIETSSYLFDVRSFGAENMLRGSSLRNIEEYAAYSNGRTDADIGFGFEDNTQEANGFALP